MAIFNSYVTVYQRVKKLGKSTNFRWPWHPQALSSCNQPLWSNKPKPSWWMVPAWVQLWGILRNSGIRWRMILLFLFMGDHLGLMINGISYRHNHHSEWEYHGDICFSCCLSVGYLLKLSPLRIFYFDLWDESQDEPEGISVVSYTHPWLSDDRCWRRSVDVMFFILYVDV